MTDDEQQPDSQPDPTPDEMQVPDDPPPPPPIPPGEETWGVEIRGRDIDPSTKESTQ
jgi:hypothetical protein